MNELIPIRDNDGAQAVLGRDLHKFLEVKDRYNDWFPRMVAYGFNAGQDFTEFSVKPNGAGRPRHLRSAVRDRLHSQEAEPSIH